MLQGVCAQPWAVGFGIGRSGCGTIVSVCSCVQYACSAMLEWVVDIRFLVGSTATADLLPDLYTRPRWSWLSKVGALMSISSLPSKEVVALGQLLAARAKRCTRS